MDKLLSLPELVLLDLDDTILRFTAGQPDFWRLAIEQHCGARDDAESLLASIAKVTQEFWADEGRAYWGRQNLLRARRIVAERGLAPYGIPPGLAHAVGDTMTRVKEDSVRPFDGALSALAVLLDRGHRLGLLTNGSSEFQRRKLRRFELESCFELILIEGELGYGKPDPRVFRGALEFFGLPAAEAVMVGDNLVADILGAQTVGVAGVWHDCHQRGVPQRCQVRPSRVIRSIDELVLERRPETPLGTPPSS